MHSLQTQISHSYHILSLAARINPDEQDKELLRNAIKTFDDWDSLVTEAENYSVAPLLFTSLHDSGIEIPARAKRQLFALIQRHRWANDARAKALNQITNACLEHSIQLIVLKGSFLAHSIYPDPSLRPMSDIDVLVPPDKAYEVIQILRDLGYSAPEHAGSQYMNEHHHLPGAHIARDGQTILVEVHHDALSGDTDASITTNNLTAPIQEFTINGARHFALGHQDQLRHLYHHMSEPASRLKLMWCVDIAFYASHFANEIDWQALEQNFPKVINALRLVDYITPLPVNVRSHVPANKSPLPAGTGISILPLSTILRKPVKDRISDLLYPSNWWLRLYYGISPDNSLFVTRWFRHPWQVLNWVSRRIGASRHNP
ncbi:nucleotidyltransferase family protein [Gammaproteobacteria bacterium]|nr:nucleotidyltransferase family protein [Gammaproteobacteria bacterium]